MRASCAIVKTAPATRLRVDGEAIRRPATAVNSPRYRGCRTSEYGPCVTSPRASGSTPKQRPSASAAISIQAQPSTAIASPAITSPGDAASLGALSTAGTITAAQTRYATGLRARRRAGERMITNTVNATATANLSTS